MYGIVAYNLGNDMLSEKSWTQKSTYHMILFICKVQNRQTNRERSKTMAASSITSWQIDGETVETVTEFIWEGGSKITADGDCSHEIKRRLHLGRKLMTNLNSLLKSKDITLPTKVHPDKAMVFPGVMYGCESWTAKKAEFEELMLLSCGVREDS